MDVGIDDVDTVFVGEGGIGPFPGGDTTTTAPEGDGGLRNPGSAEAVEEVGFSCYFAVLEVCVAEFADVNLSIVRVWFEWDEEMEV